MGIRLVMEATSSHAPGALTWRERYVLAVLASSAMDATRECPPGIEDSPDLVARLRLGRSERYAVLASLVAKGALERLERGRNGVKAVYAIAPFELGAGSERPGEPDAPPVENPPKGPGFPDASEPVKGPGSASEGSGKPGRKGPGTPDPAPYIGIKGFKTGGGTPPPPGARPLFPFALPDAPPGEGDHLGSQIRNRDRRALAAEIVGMRAEWSARSVLRALEHADVIGRPWLIAAEAMRIVAADKATDSPGRLRHPGPWWAEAARRVRGATEAAGDGPHAYDADPATGLCRCKAPREDKIHRNGRRRSA